VSITADDLVNTEADMPQGGSVKDAADFLIGELSKGSRCAGELFRGAAKIGIEKRLIWKAKDLLGVFAVRGVEDWEWQMPLKQDDTSYNQWTGSGVFDEEASG